MEPTSGRAAEVLEQLARGRDQQRSLRPVAVVAAVACVAAVGVAVLLDRRPAPVEERMPLASELADGGTHGAQIPGTAEPGTADPGAADLGAGPAGGPGGGSAAGAGATATDAPVFVHVAGAVARPGVVELPAGSRVVDAVEAAGGLRPDADADRVNLAAVLADGQRIVVPVEGQPPPEEVHPTGPAPSGDPGTGGSGGTAGAGPKVELNSATAEQLDSLPGIGPATAAAIIGHRERHGPFRSVDDLIEVRGIGEAKLEALRDLVTVDGAR